MRWYKEISRMVGMSEKGVTLLELMVVLALISILTTLSITSYLDSLPKMRAREAARQIWSDIHLARSDSVKSKIDVVMIFNTTNNTYSIVEDTNNDMYDHAKIMGDVQSTDKYIVKDKKLPEGVIFASGAGMPVGVDSEPLAGGVTVPNNRIFFHPSGRAGKYSSINKGDGIDYLIEDPDRSIYVISSDMLRKNNYESKKYGKDTSAVDLDGALYGITLQPISGLPKVWTFNPKSKKWVE